MRSIIAATFAALLASCQLDAAYGFQLNVAPSRSMGRNVHDAGTVFKPTGSMGSSSTLTSKIGSPSVSENRRANTLLLASLAPEPFIALSLRSIGTFYKTFPYLAAFLTCGFKASMADLIAQKKFGNVQTPEEAAAEAEELAELESSTTNLEATATSSQSAAVDATASSASSSVQLVTEEGVSDPEPAEVVMTTATNFSRLAAFLLYGGFYQGCVQEYMFNHVFPRLFGAAVTPKSVASKVAFDLCFLSPMCTLPVAYLAKAIIFRYGIIEGLSRYWHDIRHNGLFKKYVMLWAPANTITFSVIPPHFRVSFVAFISFFWMIVLSYITSKSDRAAAEEQNMEECRLVDGATCE